MIIILDISKVVLKDIPANEQPGKETGSHEVVTKYAIATERYEQAMNRMRKFLDAGHAKLQKKMRANTRGRQQSHARDIMSAKMVPILLGSGTKNEVIAVKDIRQVVPEDLHRNGNILEIEHLEKQAELHAAAKKYIMAAECYEQAINLRRKFLGEGHPEFLLSIERYVCNCNFWGVQCLGAGQYTSSLELLKKAEAQTEAENVPNFKRRVALRAATFNNLCCYFRTRGKLNAALQFVEKALKIEQRYKDSENPARTHLNYAVLLSMMGRHEEAVGHNESAIAFLQDEEHSLAQSRVFDGEEDGEDAESQQRLYQEVVSTLVVAYHNMFVELTRLSRREVGAECLLRAANIAKQKLGQAHALTVKMEECLASVADFVPKHPTMGALSITDGDRYEEGGTGVDRLPALVTPSSPSAMDRASPRRDVAGAFEDQRPLVPRPPPGRPPEGPAPPLRKSLKQLHVKEHIYGRAVHHSVQDGRVDQRSRIDEPKSTHVGSPTMQQAQHGAKPMASVRATRQPIEDGTAYRGARGGRVSPSGAQPPKPAAGPPPAPDQHPASPQIRAAYAFHMRKSQKREIGEEEGDRDIRASPERVRAIAALKGRLHSRTEQGLPMPTDTNRVKAATKIQAHYRGHVARQWSVEELAHDAHRVDRLDTLSRRYPNHPTVQKMLTSPGYGPEDNKRKVAYRVVYAARRAFVEYGAAVKIQKCWRGWSTRREIQGEIARVAHETATRLQALFRRYRVACWMGRRIGAAIAIQSAWKRWHLGKRTKEMIHFMRLLSRISLGCTVRLRLWRTQQAAITFQRTIRGFLTRCRESKRQQMATEIQKVVRGWLWRQRLALLTRTINRIAAGWRGHVARKKLRTRHKAALSIQTRWRTLQAIRLAVRMQAAAQKILGLWRAYQVREGKCYLKRVMLIQAHFKGVLCREKLRQWPVAAEKIQAWWRAHKVRRQFKTRVAVAVVLQKLTRRHLAVRRLRFLHAGTVLCQKISRGFRTRRDLAVRVACALRLQAFWRSAVARCQAVEMQLASSKMQAFVRTVFAWRRHRAVKKAAEIIRFAWKGHRLRMWLRKRNAAAIFIGRWWRAHLARKLVAKKRAAVCKLQLAFRTYRALKIWARKHKAATKIRAFYKARLGRRAFLKYKFKAIIGIQKMWKQYLECRRYKTKRRLAIALQALMKGINCRRHLERREEMAVKIQCAWRSMVQKHGVKLANNAATRIQAAVRGIFARRQIRNERKAAVQIQRVLRGVLSRRDKRRMQAVWRITAWLSARMQRWRYLKQRGSIIVIQTYWRTIVSKRRHHVLTQKTRIIRAAWQRRRQRLAENKQFDTATKLQRNWRRKVAWLRVARMQKAAVRIQKMMRRVFVNQKLAKKSVLAVKLQALWRRKLAQRRYKKILVLVSKLIRLVRCFFARRDVREKFRASARIVSMAKVFLTKKLMAKQFIAAIEINKMVRGYLARKHVHIMRTVGPCAIQNFYRQTKAKEDAEKRRMVAQRQELKGSKFREDRTERLQHAAATRIQAFVRMRMERRTFLRKVHWALPKIQALNRMVLVRKRWYHQKRSVVYIQKCIRAFCCAKLSRQHAAARVIQRGYRRHLIQSTSELSFNSFLRLVWATTRIQASWRRFKARWRYMRRLFAITKIQAQIRAYLGARQYERKVQAAVRIQASIFLPWLCARRVMYRRQAAIKLQSIARSLLAKRRVRRMQEAALRIQSAWRCALDCWLVVSRRHQAATRIQAFIRMHWQRKVAYPKRRRALSLIQALGRGYLVRKTLRDRHAKALRIQQKVRLGRFRKVMAAILWITLAIQRIWRGRKTRVDTLKAFRHLRRIPARSRGLLWRSKRWPNMVGSVVTIQRVWRGRCTRIALAKRTRAAVTIQAYRRMLKDWRWMRKVKWAKRIILGLVYLVRFKRSAANMKEFYDKCSTAFIVYQPIAQRKRVRADAVRLQRVQRGSAARRRLRNTFCAASRMQAHARRCMARAVFEKRVRAVLKLQAWLDGIYRKRQYNRTRERIYSLQAYIKMWVARRHFLAKVAAVTEISRIWRGHAARSRLALEERASLKISSSVRAMIAFKRLARQRKAITYIQKMWRGYKARKVLQKAVNAVNMIAATWRMYVGLQRYRQKRRAGEVLVCSGWMYRHIRLHKQRSKAATKLAAVWRGYCARLNIWHMRQAVFKIAKWWDTIKTWQLCSDAIIEVLVEARMLREFYDGEQAAKIQRAWRARKAGARPIILARMAALKIQCMFRRRKAIKVVNAERARVGVNLKHYPSQMMVLVADKKGRLTRSRLPADEQELQEATVVKRPIADLTKLSETMRLDLEDALSNLQGHFRLLAKIKGARRIQALVRGLNGRKKLAKMQEQSVKIQSWARAREARKRVRVMRANLELIQASARRHLAKKTVEAEKSSKATAGAEATAEEPAEEEQQVPTSEAQPSS
eukprot:gnl/MRDRNA2_/MRDRNA2_59273_c0_seq2.p1 gnl/MRDRNA2_/MRDRNA2_59273_c0~~gnl/MRDRNA2_/MRDRNA2_59273_c0_seq2.p1  ORF type:complete len:2426 (+),score=455.57 gnl/MRDRNA2_/MRDRNA2_59273_c0_seq2:120-7397(+)